MAGATSFGPAGSRPAMAPGPFSAIADRVAVSKSSA
jgi:hypothetical protein